MSANVQIDAESIHIGPKVVCNRAQDVNSEINVLCCKISLKVCNKLILWIETNVCLKNPIVLAITFLIGTLVPNCCFKSTNSSSKRFLPLLFLICLCWVGIVTLSISTVRIELRCSRDTGTNYMEPYFHFRLQHYL